MAETHYMTSHLVNKEFWAAYVNPIVTPEGVVDEFVYLLGQAWAENAHLIRPWNIENNITKTILAWMRDKLRSLDFDWGVSSQSESLTSHIHSHATVDGICDITIHLRAKEIIYECKRVNIINDDGKVSSKATDYVRDGMYRFTNSRIYRADFGICGMIAFVMNGDIVRARKRVFEAISAAYFPFTTQDPALPSPCRDGHHYKTYHAISPLHSLHVCHIFLPVQI